MINKRQHGGLVPQLQQDNLNQAYCHKAHNVDLSSNSIRPAQLIETAYSNINAQSISFDRNRLVWSTEVGDVFSTSNTFNFRFSKGRVYVDRNRMSLSNPQEPYLPFPEITNFSVTSDRKIDVCESDFNAYRIRYINDFGEISDVLAVSDLQNGNGSLSWSAINIPTNGSWIIERVVVPYQQMGKHTNKEYKDNFFVIDQIPVSQNSYSDVTPLAQVCDALPSFIDAITIDKLNVDVGVVTEQGELIVARKNDTLLYVSYPNKPYLFPIYNVIDTGNPIKAIVQSPKGAIIFHEHGTGILSLETSNGELTPTSHYSYFKTSNNVSVTNPNTISVRNNMIYFMSHLGLVMYPLGMTITPQVKVVTFDVMADEVGKLNEDTLIGQAYEDGYYLTDGTKTFLITNLDSFYMDTREVVIRTTSIKSRIVSCDAHGFLLFKDGTDIKKTKFRYRIINPKTSPIHVKIYGVDDRGYNLVYERDVLHSDTFAVRNSFMYKKYSIEIRFGGVDRASHDCIYQTKISLTKGLKSFGRCKIVRDVTEDTLRITEFGLMSRVHQFLSLKPT